MPESHSELLAELAREWNRIEGRAKEVETFRGEAIVAAINEMRYAGRRIVDFIIHVEKSEFEQATEVLLVARNYLTNADHDLTDAVIFFVHQRVSLVEGKYGRSKIEQCCPRFKELYPAIKEAHEIVQGSREDRTKRLAEYKKLADEYVPRLMELHKDIVSSDELSLDEQIGVLERNVRLVAWFSFVGSVASVIGVGLAIWGIWLAWPTAPSAANTPSTVSIPAPPAPQRQP